MTNAEHITWGDITPFLKTADRKYQGVGAPRTLKGQPGALFLVRYPTNKGAVLFTLLFYTGSGIASYHAPDGLPTIYPNNRLARKALKAYGDAEDDLVATRGYDDDDVEDPDLYRKDLD